MKIYYITDGDVVHMNQHLFQLEMYNPTHIDYNDDRKRAYLQDRYGVVINKFPALLCATNDTVHLLVTGIKKCKTIDNALKLIKENGDAN